MAQLVKQWSTGTGNLSVTYEGDGDGTAVFASDTNEGIDRVMDVAFKAGDVVEQRIVTQEGLRQPFGLSGGGVFRIKGGGRYGVLKVGEPIVPPTPMETYTRLTYIECNGKQYINTGYVVQEDDVIDMYYISTAITSHDKALFGSVESGNGIWATIYSATSYVRFGGQSSIKVNNAGNRYTISLRKSKVAFDDLNGSLEFDALPTIPLYVFASNNNNSSVNMYGYCRSMGFKITKASGEVVMDLKPCKRDSDGKVGMLDIVSGQFFASAGSEEFIGGSEVAVTDGYEIIDYISFNNDKVFDTGFFGNENTYIDVMFKRTDISGSDYLFGISTGKRLTAYLTSSGYWRYGDAYPTFNSNNNVTNYAKVTPTGTTLSGTLRSFAKQSAFTTSFTIPLGGYKASTNSPIATYQGYIHFFRMWHGDTLLVDWYPCRRKSDGEEGFWDCINQTFVEKYS